MSKHKFSCTSQHNMIIESSLFQ